MIKKLKQNLLIKFISVVIAFVVWLLVANAKNPIVNNFVNVEVNVINEAEIYKLNKSYMVHSPRTCKIQYKINADQSALVRQGDFKAYIDLADLLTSNDIPIQFEVLNGVDCAERRQLIFRLTEKEHCCKSYRVKIKVYVTKM